MNKEKYKIAKEGGKWIIEGKGEGEGWIFNKKFPTKWKAEIALKVFQEGGKVSDYWREAREHAEKRMKRRLVKVTKQLEEALKIIKDLDPTCEEIIEYAERNKGVYGLVTSTRGEEYFGPHLHDTWGLKRGGRAHIDIGCGGYHLMLDKRWV